MLGNPELVSVSLVYNVPLVIDCLHFILQFYVVQHCLVDVVLGQPFLHCTSMTLTYCADGKFGIILSKPSQQLRYLLETLPIPNAWDVEQVPLSMPARGGVLHLGTADDLEPARTDQTLLRRLHQWPPAPWHNLAERLSNQPHHHNHTAAATPRSADQGWSVVQ